MSVAIERDTRKEDNPREPLLIKARALWDFIAPGREPSVLTSAVMDLRLRAPGVKPQTPEQQYFVETLQRYTLSHDYFSLFLKVNENQRDANFSFLMALGANVEFQVVDTPVEPSFILAVREFSRGTGIRRFLSPYAIEIVGEDGRQLVAPDQWEEAFVLTGFSRANMGWRRKFVSSTLDLLIEVANRGTLEERQEQDVWAQNWMARNGDFF